VDRLIACKSQLKLHDEADSKRDLTSHPIPEHAALTTRSNYRVRLLLGCHGLEMLPGLE